MCPPEARTEAKVSQFDVSVLVNEDIVRLDVTMDEAHLVDTFNC